jgi:hypothetical protein
MSFVYKLEHKGVLLHKSEEPQKVFDELYELMRQDKVEPETTFTTDLATDYSKGIYYIVYSIDYYHFGHPSMSIESTIKDALEAASKVHYGPQGNFSCIYEVNFDGKETVTILKRLQTETLTITRLKD